jgi:hypothetical protein
MEQSELLRFFVQVMEMLGVRYLVTGSLATTAYGEPRFTNDIDVVVDLRPEHVDGFCAAFSAPQFYLSRDAVAAAVRDRHQFNVIEPASGAKIDVMIASDSAFDRGRLTRAIRLHVAPDLEACFSSPEDVIIKKMQYYKEGGSDKHVRDILGVLKVRGHDLDRDYVARWAKEFELTDIWNRIRQQAGGT